MFEFYQEIVALHCNVYPTKASGSLFAIQSVQQHVDTYNSSSRAEYGQQQLKVSENSELTLMSICIAITFSVSLWYSANLSVFLSTKTKQLGDILLRLCC